MAVTIKDIARLAEVSVSTVSRSLNDSPRISPETKERVKRLAAELDFEFDASARSLSTRHSGTVAFVVPASLGCFSNTLYLNLLIYDIRAGLAARGYDCIVTEALAPNGQSNIRRLVLQRKVDGIILLLETNRPEDWSLLKKRGLPVVHVHYMPAYIDTESLDYYFTDNIAGGRMAGEALFRSGSRRIACLVDQACNPEMSDRERGCREALAALDPSLDPAIHLEAANAFEAAYKAVRDNSRLIAGTDGIFVATDIMALGALRGLADEGIRVPEDIRIVGYDDVEIGTYVRPGLTTIHQPREEIARLACDRLDGLLQARSGGGVEQRLISPRLVRRGSC
jgi:LacI family transcriptional regulator